ncbi:MAG: Ig-like domain-containing protein, partial [Gemmatimonadota bacterium]|nr:Ig-like domain-containing protein [Gemmatimonadota bacterium]
PRLSRLVVSSPIASTASARRSGATDASIASTDSVVYVSMPAGASPSGVFVSLRVAGQPGTVTTATLVDGGFDPVAVRASVGEVVTSDILDFTGAVTADSASVPLGHPPAVVRTSPAAGRTDVPLSTVVVVVFDEPMDSASVVGGIHLTLGGVPVSGVIAPVADGAVGKFVFRPSELLRPFSTYELEISGGVRDAQGRPLGSTMTIEFATSGTSIDPPDGLAVNSFKVLEFFDNVAHDYMEAPQLRVSAYPADSNLHVVAFSLVAVPEDSTFRAFTCFTDQKIPPGASREIFGQLSDGDFPLTSTFRVPLAGTRVSASVAYHLGDGVVRTVEFSTTVEHGVFNDKFKPTNAVWSHCT